MNIINPVINLFYHLKCPFSKHIFIQRTFTTKILYNLDSEIYSMSINYEPASFWWCTVSFCHCHQSMTDKEGLLCDQAWIMEHIIMEVLFGPFSV